MSDMRLSVLVEMLDKFTSPMRGMQDALKKTGETARVLGGAVSGVVDKLTSGYAGLAGAIGGGIALREIAKENDYFNRLRILSGKSAEEVDNLRHSLTANAREAGVSGEELKDAFTAMREGGLTGAFTENAGTLAAAIQLLNGSGYELGQTFVSLNRFMNIKTPVDLAQAFATLREQLKGIPGGLDALAPRLGKLTSDMAAMGRTGLDGMKEIGALYSIARPGAASSREAVSTTEMLIGSFRDMDFRSKVKNLGITVAPGQSDEERAVNEDKGLIRSPVDIIKDILDKFKDHPSQMEQFLGGGFAEALKVPLGQMKMGTAGGAAPVSSLNTAMNVTGDVGKFRSDSEQLATSFDASMNRMRGALAEVGERFAPVIDAFATALSALATPLGNLFGALGGLVLFIKALGWVNSFRLGLLESGKEALKLGRVLVGPLIGAIGNFVIALRAGYGVMEAFNLVLAANPIGLVILGVAALAGAVFLIYKNWEPIKKWFADLWDGIVKRVTQAIDAIRGLIKSLPTWLGGDGKFAPAADHPSKNAGTSGANDPTRYRADPTRHVGHQRQLALGPGGAVQPDQKTNVGGTVKVEFNGAPEGMRVTDVQSENRKVPIDVYMGWSMVGP
jgi:hypothetical protein